MLSIAFPLLLLIFSLCVWSLLFWLICVLSVSPWVYPVWDSLGFLDLGGYFLPHFREVFRYYLLKYFLIAFLFVLFFGDFYDSNVVVFNIVHRSLRLSSLLKILFSFFHSASFISTILSSTSLILSSALVILLLVPSRVLLISVYCIIHYWLTLFYFF